MRITHQVCMTTGSVTVDGRKLATKSQGVDLLSEVYRSHVGDYPKFFKMDLLCKLGFVASELLLQAEGDRHTGCDDRAVVLFNRSASLNDDVRYQETINDENDFYPSPAVFVYTLPNIVTGEIAIRNKYYGETSFFVLDERDEVLMQQLLQSVFDDGYAKSAITGWVECDDSDFFEAYLTIVYND